MALFTDDFNRADANPIAGNWTTQGGSTALRIVSTEVAGTVDNQINSAYVNSVSPNADQYAQCVIVSAAPTGGGPLVRMATGALTAYGVQVYGGGATFELFYLAAGSYNSLAVTSITHSAGDVYKVQAIGTAIKGYRNGVELLSATDANLASGKAGLYCFALANRYDTYEAGNTSSGFQAAWARGSNQVIIA